MSNPQLLIDEIKLSLAKLGGLLRQNTPLQACVSLIPPVLKGDETEPLELIHPEEHRDLDAIEFAAHAFNDLHIVKPWSQKATRRYVGVIRFPEKTALSLETVALIKHINLTKASLERYITDTYSTRSMRFAAIRECAHGIMTKHLYRQILCFDRQEIKSVRFSWQRKDSVVLPSPKKFNDLIAQIQQAILSANEYTLLPLEQLLTNLSMVNPDQLRLRYPIKVQPAANVVSYIPPEATRIARPAQDKTDGSFNGEIFRKTYNAPLPVLVFQDIAIKTAPIKQFNAQLAATRKQRNDKQRTQIIGSFSGVQIELLS
ncbi:DNA replication terminus site-binding protein [Cellvibrio sp. NN19]|uniref:DNA replication terminus site-binding protein n=1 Tax=Cellvibrio chitinivorans TaxID=3102792 RepID=UPI002B417AF2|nr:DNA replication terminus site-binding protein [Cellvibrio sp. NN19]